MLGTEQTQCYTEKHLQKILLRHYLIGRFVILVATYLILHLTHFNVDIGVNSTANT